jgi:putative transcription factor
MVSCELCGKQATTKAKVEGVVFSVCAGCASLGVEVKVAPAQTINRKYQSDPVSRPSRSTPLIETLLAADFAQRLRKARMQMGLTEKEAGLKLNIRESVLLHYESGKSVPDDSTAKKLEKFYGIKLFESY